MSKVQIRRSDDPTGAGAGTVATLERDQVVSVIDDNGNVQSQVRLSELRETYRVPVSVPVVADAPPAGADAPPVAPPVAHPLPDALPDWAMDLATHQSTFQRTAVYRCLHCHGEHEEYRQNPRSLPYAKVCNSALEDAEGNLTTCTAPALRRVTYPGEGVALNARRFEPLVIYERANYTVDQLARGLNRYYIPGRNNEPTEPGMKRIELTDIHSYNRVQKEISGWETNLMSARRETHREYFAEQRKRVRDDVNARFSQSSRYLGLRQLMRARSDRKSAERYGKALNANFHAQLLEFNQSNMQSFCAEDTGWRERRAR